MNCFVMRIEGIYYLKNVRISDSSILDEMYRTETSTRKEGE